MDSELNLVQNALPSDFSQISSPLTSNSIFTDDRDSDLERQLLEAQAHVQRLKRRQAQARLRALQREAETLQRELQNHDAEEFIVDEPPPIEGTGETYEVSPVVDVSSQEPSLPSSPPTELAVHSSSTPDDAEGTCGNLSVLEGYSWTDIELAKKAVRDQAVSEGFSVSERRPTYYFPTKVLRRVDYVCTQGKARPSRGTTGKKTNSHRNNCPFQCSLNFNKALGIWRFKMKEPRHKHMSSEAWRFSVYRKHSIKRHEAAVKEAVHEYIDHPRMTAGNVVERLIKAHPDLKIYEQDIRNRAAQWRKLNVGVYTDTQAFLNELIDDPDVIYRSKLQEGNTGAVEHVIWMSLWSVEMVKRNFEVLIIDNTYKTNRFDRPLMQIAGITSAHTTFCVASAIMLSETEESYRWVLGAFLEMMEGYEVKKPYVIITDKDEAARNAIRSLYPSDETATQLCLWHIQKNVAANVKRKWRGSLEGTRLGYIDTLGSRTSFEREEIELSRIADSMLVDSDRHMRADTDDIRVLGQAMRFGRLPSNDPSGRQYVDSADGVLAAWKDCVYASTEQRFMERWQALQHEFSSQQGIIEYLEDTYVCVHEEFVEYSTCQQRNYGVRVTSRVEGLHKDLKKELKSRNGSFLTLYRGVKRYLEKKKKLFGTAHHEDCTKLPMSLIRNPYNLLLQNVSRKALFLIHAEEQAAQSVGSQCSCSFPRQYGLPCRHRIKVILERGAQIEMSKVHTHWWTRLDSGEENESMRRRRVQDPSILPRRPRDQPSRRRHDQGTTRVVTSHDRGRSRRGRGGGRGSRSSSVMTFELEMTPTPTPAPERVRQSLESGQSREFAQGTERRMGGESQPIQGDINASSQFFIQSSAQTPIDQVSAQVDVLHPSPRSPLTFAGDSASIEPI
ncbi:hypothetical protein AAP_02252 [Ascosphaera apis ARSEF 7405]|uniref:SWIM-type domain-containing protein n=1 Tax=Ascosphaera apis ARSEF 7405 TaxID=392613 RepID=A0A166NZB1_9EURO|nr:hypothetical protein AAP_02252 [Ascosphaera apis ARSEF 7405]